MSSSHRSRSGVHAGHGGHAWVTGVGAAQDRIRAAAGRTELVLDRLVHAVSELVDAPATVALLEDGELVRRAATGEGRQPLGSRVETATSVCGEALRTHAPVRVGDARALPVGGPDATCCPPARSMLSVPLAVRGTAVGVVALTSDRPDWFDGVDENTATLIAAVAAEVLLAALPASVTPRTETLRFDDGRPRLVDVTDPVPASAVQPAPAPAPAPTAAPEAAPAPVGPDVAATLVLPAVRTDAPDDHLAVVGSASATAAPAPAASPEPPEPPRPATIPAAATGQRLPALGLWQWDAGTGLATLSEPVEALAGLPPGRPGVLGAFRALVHPDDVTRVEAEIRSAASSGRDATVASTFRLAPRAGVVRTVQVWGTLQCNRKGLVGAVGALADVTDPAVDQPTEALSVGQGVVRTDAATEPGAGLDVPRQVRDQVRLGRLAAADPVTGLANRGTFERRVTELLAVPGADVALLLLDVDRFRQVNDSLGHDVGDRLLVEVSRRVAAVAPEGSLVARTGGDEFALLPRPDLGLLAVRRLAEAVTDALRMPYLLPEPGELLVCPVSLGISSTAGRDVTAPDLLAEAELALQRAKDSGRDRYVVYDEALGACSQSRHRAERLLRSALEQGRLAVQYQPIVDVADGRVVGAEALVRIRDASGDGLLAPDVFLDVAEDTGLVVDVDRWVIETAIDQSQRWARRLPAGSERPWLSVNVSARSMEHPGAVRGLLDAVRHRRVAATDIKVELTERSFLAALPAGEGSLRQLLGSGIPVGIDDFGTGYSALGYLTRFDLDFMKIDRSLVAAVGEDQRADAVVTAFVDLAHAHGLVVTAEGVETPQQARRLREIGCDLAQGFHYGRPAEAARIVAD